jgi:fatty-acyl-CoA synthase
MPATSLENVLCYETLLSEENDSYDWPDMDERSASSLCYTSGTTGHPKGVLYDHRSTVLHAYGACLPDVMSLSNRDSVLAVVPMFHANAWALPYACPMVGAKLVLPGHLMGDPAALHRLMEEERVTVTLGVPTVWLGLLAYLEKSGARLESLERLVVGGAACPESIMKTFSETYGVRVHHSWGMTEMSPVGVFNTPTRKLESMTRDERKVIELKQGRGVFGVEMRVVDDEGAELPWDGEQSGALQVRGPWVCKSYFRDEGPDEAHGADGWFDTGDVANIDPAGFMQITDRAKDVIKSGGEWISSIDLENAAIGHPGVAEAAVIGVAHPKWSERPLLLVVTNEGATIGRSEMLQWFEGKVAKWWVPDDVLFVGSLPHTATGKLSKVELRKMYGDHRLPNEDAR